ncbi:hypothetical protein [Leptolyngbya ohadii]|nr:hypothetical protein [Leptolyngbya ohadii]
MNLYPKWNDRAIGQEKIYGCRDHDDPNRPPSPPILRGTEPM